MHRISPKKLWTYLATAACIILGVHGEILAQYSEQVRDLKGAADQYDERGYEGNKALSVDGTLMVSPSNGNVSYTYPISNHLEGGYPIDVTLNYCGSVGFTAFKDYNLAHDLNGTTYSGWSRFHQNRPAWILGVNGFALNVIATASHFHADSASPVFGALNDEFDDSHMNFVIDGYDFCNRMTDFDPVGANQAGYVDVIRLLRSDGSTLELYNVHQRQIGDADPDTRPELYTGYYILNQANTRSYGIVEYDSTYWPSNIRDAAGALAPSGQRAALVPRKLRYFPGDGLEYVFREWVIPYGLKAYKDIEERSGGMWGGPTIFYLEEIRSNSGKLVDFYRTRHYPIFGNPLFENRVDETRGRALTTSFTGHEISFGYNSMLIEALGRTYKVKFDAILRNGNAVAGETFPFANNGSMTTPALQLAEYDETNPQLYKSFVGYVTQIIDPENRVTSFEYEPTTKVYKDFNFPRANQSSGQQLTFKGYRLKTVREPDVRYAIRYQPASPYPITPSNMGQSYFQPTVNNVADSVSKYDTYGGLLSTDKYAVDFSTNIGTQYTYDRLSGQQKTTTYQYSSTGLTNLAPYLYAPRHTMLNTTTTVVGDLTTVTTTQYAQGSGLTGAGCNSPYVILPVSSVTTTNGITTSEQHYSYLIDTVRFYGGDLNRAGRYGMEITQQVTRTVRPDSPSVTMFVDTTRYLHLPAIDTTVTWTETRWNKLASLENYLTMRRDNDPLLAGRRWEDVMYSAPVAVFENDTITDRVTAPPVYNLTTQSWRSDAEGIVAGVKNVYRTDVTRGGLRELRGNLLSDSIMGRGGYTLPGRTYGYTEGWGTNLLTYQRGMFGAETFYGYDFCLPPVNGTQYCPAPPQTMTLSNDDSVRSASVKFNAFPLWYGAPLVTRNVVRRYSDTGLVYDTLTSYTERTYFGLASGTSDANGWYSKYEYDKNGRLVMGWAPADFPRTNALDTFSYAGHETGDLYGETYYHRREDTLHCEKDANTGIVTSYTWPGTVRETVSWDTLYASMPVTQVPDCPCESEETARAGKGGSSREMLATCNQDLPFNEHEGFRRIHAKLHYPVDSASPLKSVTSLDSLYLEMMVSSVQGECVHLEVAIDSIFSRTFIFNCSIEDPPNGTGRAKDGRGTGRSLLSGDGSSLTPVAGGYTLKVNLASVADELLATPYGGTIHFALRVKTAGATVAFVSGTNVEDLRPKLHVVGEFDKVWDKSDYTIAFEHDDQALTSTERGKVDDINHTENRFSLSGPFGGTIRRTETKHRFGVDDRLLRSEMRTIEDGGVRTDVMEYAYTGLGARTRTIDPVGDSVIMHYNSTGLPSETINTDSTRTKFEYAYGTPGDFFLTGQDFFGFCSKVTATDERGMVHERYSDAFGRLRRTVDDPSGMALEVRYDYDIHGRLMKVTNPKGDVTSYTYGWLGRRESMTQPDIGRITYGYDDLGNLRFSQNQKQADDNRMTFNQYDDLGRLTVVGEATIWSTHNEDDDDLCLDCFDNSLRRDDMDPLGKAQRKRAERTMQGEGDTRYSLTLNPNDLHDGAANSILTANRTLWLPPHRPVPRVQYDFGIRGCAFLTADTSLGETEAPSNPKIVRPAPFYLSGSTPMAKEDDFEHMARYPEFGRMAVAYDALPPSVGSVWGGFPDEYSWGVLAPKGSVRNLKGQAAAVAYRERSGEPYNYVVTSYDERGRVEAILRYTENLGFDAVYYSYNSRNDVTRVTGADVLRQFTTFYGYDHNGRIDSVWTSLSGAGNGLYSFFGHRYPFPQDRPDSADIVYNYTRLGLVDSIAYPPANVVIAHGFNKRRWLDTLIAVQPRPDSSADRLIFRQNLSYDESGNLKSQEWQHATGPVRQQEYSFDDVDRLIGWKQGADTVGYVYDQIGNRLQASSNGMVSQDDYSYVPWGNGIAERVQTYAGSGGMSTFYTYNANGSVTQRRTYDIIGGNLYDKVAEQYGYSHRELMRRFVKFTPPEPEATPTMEEDWRYRYNPMGERDQKRLYYRRGQDAVPDPDGTLPWVYYLLGGRTQLAVYHGQQTSKSFCNDTGQRVYMYPVEYLTHALDYNGTQEDLSRIVTRPNGRKQFRISDHLGSLRATVDSTAIVAYDYDPWGTLLNAPVTGASRRTYTDKEQDRESGEFNLGVRQYAGDEGRFGAVDALYENSPSHSPYIYGNNNPLKFTDPTGLNVDPVATMTETFDETDNGGGASGGLGKEGVWDSPVAGPGFSGVAGGLVLSAAITTAIEWVRGLFSDDEPAEAKYKEAEKDATHEPNPRPKPLGSKEKESAGIPYPARTGATPKAQAKNDGPKNSGTSGKHIVVPPKAREVLNYIRTFGGFGPEGYKGGDTFNNVDKNTGKPLLPTKDSKGNNITYKEYDVNTQQPGANRGPERIVIGSNGDAYYTNDHYKTFKQMR